MKKYIALCIIISLFTCCKKDQTQIKLAVFEKNVKRLSQVLKIPGLAYAIVIDNKIVKLIL